MRSILLILMALTFFSCKNVNKKKKEKEPTHKEEAKHWSYMGETGPEHWVEIEKQSDCNGERQSPINIIDTNVQTDQSLKPIDIHYSNNVMIHDLMNNGHTIQYNFDMGDYILLNEEKFELLQFHFHEAAEHTINGIRYPLEMHLVHANKDREYAVLAVFAQEGESNEAFEFLERYLPVQMGEAKPVGKSFDLNLNLPKNKAYYTYKGSLTTPPCTQTVNWFIFKNPIIISVDQITQIRELMPLNNYRNEQAINGRVISQYNPN